MRAHTWRKLEGDAEWLGVIPAHHWACEACDCTISSNVDGIELKWGTMRDNCYAPNERHPGWKMCRHIGWVFNGDSRTSGKCFDCGWRSSFDEYLEFVQAGRKVDSGETKGGE